MAALVADEEDYLETSMAHNLLHENPIDRRSQPFLVKNIMSVADLKDGSIIIF